MEGFSNELHYELREEKASCGKEQRRHSSVHFSRYSHDPKNSFSPIRGPMTEQRTETMSRGCGLEDSFVYRNKLLFVNRSEPEKRLLQPISRYLEVTSNFNAKSHLGSEWYFKGNATALCSMWRGERRVPWPDLRWQTAGPHGDPLQCIENWCICLWAWHGYLLYI